MADGITELLAHVRAQQPGAQDALLAAVYDELKQLAAVRLRRERPGHTLQPTALVHEAWAKLLGRSPGTWNDRSHFFATAAKVMRQLLVDQARQRNAQKRGGDRKRITWQEASAAHWAPSPDEIIAIHDALEQLAEMDAARAKVVELRFFAGFTVEETAAVMGLSERTVYGMWKLARAWLFRELGG